MFSKRVPHDLTPNALAVLRERRGAVPFDLTVSNPTRCGFLYPPDLLEPLASRAGLAYAPEPLGSIEARAAVARECRRHRVEVDPARIALVASTSEAYGLLFKLLCDPGDLVLKPVPSYPLFEHLARLEGIATTDYAAPVPEDPGPPAPRAVIVVQPNNPTGAVLRRREADALARWCRDRGAALIADEVFLDFPLGEAYPTDAAGTLASRADVLTFTLGGLSKSLGLPQLKLGWIVVSGPQDLARQALSRLEFVADQYLSVATPVQLALPELLVRAAPLREAIRLRCRENLRALEALAATLPALEVLRPDGGWSVPLRYPAVLDEEALVLELLRDHGVACHPGYFFDFPHEGVLVLSLLPPPEVFEEGSRRLVRLVARRLGA